MDETLNIAYRMDCMEYMRGLPDNAFDLAVVDPPYGDGNSQSVHAEREREAGQYNRFGGWWNRYKEVQPIRSEVRQVQESRGGVSRQGQIPHGTTRTGGTWSAKYGKKIIAWDTAPDKEYFDQLFRVSRNQIIWGGNYFDLPPTRCFLIWRKLNIPLEGFSMAAVEYAWTSFFTNARMFEEYSNGNSNNVRFHPTQKPVSLYAWIYRTFAKQGMKILDTHLGSGSSRIAAWDAGLEFVGTEIDETYFRLQEERFAKHTAQGRLFPVATGGAEQMSLI